MKVGSLFTGIGGFDLGFERAGMSVEWQCEIDKACNRVLGRRWPGIQVYGDVKGIDGSTPAVDLICGGFPCQDLSVAGKRAGLAGERSGLFFEFMRIVSELRPRWVVIENVPGLLSSNRGGDMGTVLTTLGKLGYWWAYRVLDAQYFGVAQRRKRLFIVGHSSDRTAATKVLFESESLRRDNPPSREARKGFTGGVIKGAAIGREPKNGPQRGEILEDGSVYTLNATEVHAVAGTLGGGSGERGWASDTDRTTFLPWPAQAVALRGRDGGATAELGGTQSNALRSSQGGGDKPYVLLDAVRRLTPTECERLQGFPDGWTEGESDSARYRMLGNAVCMPVAEWVGRRIMAVEQASRVEDAA